MGQPCQSDPRTVGKTWLTKQMDANLLDLSIVLHDKYLWKYERTQQRTFGKAWLTKQLDATLMGRPQAPRTISKKDELPHDQPTCHQLLCAEFDERPKGSFAFCQPWMPVQLNHFR